MAMMLDSREEFERLSDIIKSIQHLIDGAEMIEMRGWGQPYMPRVVYAKDLQDVLDGKLRV